MGRGAECPPDLVRYPTGGSIDKLVERLGLPWEPWMQDWELQVADFARTAEFLAAYGDPDLTEDDRFLLMAVIVASLDDGVRAGAPLGTLWPRIRRALRRDGALHASTLSYWSCGHDADPEHQFAITPLVRSVWYDVLADLAAASVR